MTEQTFELNSEYIPLIGLLKITGLAGTGGHASIMVTEGEVSVNGEIELQKRKKIRAGDVVSAQGCSINIIGKPEKLNQEAQS